MKVVLGACCLVLAIVSPAAAQGDAIDLSAAVIHNSPADIASWAPTVTISRVTMRPENDFGLSFDFSPRTRWRDYEPPGWSGGGEGLQYTVWICVPWNSQAHCSGIVQMWRTRASTGAPLLTIIPSTGKTNYNGNWCYDGRWGEMARYVPRAGDTVWFFLSAGNARAGSAPGADGVTSHRERSNVVAIRLPADDRGVFTFDAVSEPPPLPPTPTPVPPPVFPPSSGMSGAQYEHMIALLSNIRQQIEDEKEWLYAEKNREVESDRMFLERLDGAVSELRQAVAANKGGGGSGALDIGNLATGLANLITQILRARGGGQ